MDVTSQGLENEKRGLFQGSVPRFGTLPLIPMLAVRRELLRRLLGETVVATCCCWAAGCCGCCWPLAGMLNPKNSTGLTIAAATTLRIKVLTFTEHLLTAQPLAKRLQVED